MRFKLTEWIRNSCMAQTGMYGDHARPGHELFCYPSWSIEDRGRDTKHIDLPKPVGNTTNLSWLPTKLVITAFGSSVWQS